MLAELEASFAVIGDVQFLPGCSLALTKPPGVDRLSGLPRREGGWAALAIERTRSDQGLVAILDDLRGDRL